MSHMRGWGLLLAIAMPLLILFSWGRLTAETSRINVERYSEWAGRDGGRFTQPLVDFLARNGRLARPGDVQLAPFPQTSGVKSWSIQPDTVLHVELDAKDDGRPVVLRYVPMVRGQRGVLYDCVSASSKLVVGRFCRADQILSEAAIPAQLAANERALAGSASPDAPSGQPAASVSGRVLAVPADAAGIEACGYPCVRSQACVNPRPLVCSRLVTVGAVTRLELAPTPGDHMGSALATLAEADAVCERAVGAGGRVLRAGGIGGVGTALRGGDEYWLHDDVQPNANCWSSTAR